MSLKFVYKCLFNPIMLPIIMAVETHGGPMEQNFFQAPIMAQKFLTTFFSFFTVIFPFSTSPCPGRRNRTTFFSHFPFLIIPLPERRNLITFFLFEHPLVLDAEILRSFF